MHQLVGGALEIAWALRRRGLVWAGGNAEHELLFGGSALGPDELSAFYSQMHSYAFRLFLRDIIYHRTGFGLADLQRYVNEATAARYLAHLSDWRMVEPVQPDRWRLCSNGARSFGETLEWYVAQLFARGFGCSTAWGVRATLAGSGGDYDVLSMVEGRLICVEVKSSPPKHIDVPTIVNFLRRMDDLGPALSIFLEDTHLRLEDKIIPLFREAIGQLWGERGELGSLLVRERRHLYSLRLPSPNGAWPAVYIASSRPSLEANLAYCLRRLLVPRSMPSPAVQASLSALAGSGPEDPTLPPEPPTPATEPETASTEP